VIKTSSIKSVNSTHGFSEWESILFLIESRKQKWREKAHQFIEFVLVFSVSRRERNFWKTKLVPIDRIVADKTPIMILVEDRSEGTEYSKKSLSPYSLTSINMFSKLE
jgi:hypothetical protein